MHSSRLRKFLLLILVNAVVFVLVEAAVDTQKGKGQRIGMRLAYRTAQLGWAIKEYMRRLCVVYNKYMYLNVYIQDIR